MKIEQKTYAQILIVNKTDFIFSATYSEYEQMCPFLCFAGYFARDFRCSLKNPDGVVPEKDVILLLEDYWDLLTTDEKKAILDHELGHISNGDLKEIVTKIKKGENISTEVNEAHEKAADAYSADMNGSKAIYQGLMKALEVIVAGYRKKGYNITVDKVLATDKIIQNRLKVLKDNF